MGADRRMPWAWLLPVALVLALAAGCGTNDAEPDEEPAVEAPEPPDQPPEVDAAEDPPEDLEGAPRRFYEACRGVVERAPGVPEETRRNVIADCESAARGDEGARRRAARAACDVAAAAIAPALLRGRIADACKRAISEAVLRT